MENASKALIMAGSVLIALLIVGTLVLMFNHLSSFQNVDENNAKEAQIIEFNNQYETFNRKNVRGSDLYSLLNRVVDYNRRKSSEGTGKDAGQYLAYEPMTIQFSLVSSKGGRELFSVDQSSNLLLKTKNEYIQSSTRNDFANEIASEVDRLENTYGKESLTALTTGLTKIFIDDKSTDTEKAMSFKTFSNASKKVTILKWEEINEGSKIRKDIYTYYEYVQFKRARFDCTNIEYNKNTGRIVKMEFKFTGKFE
ncbi:MAG: hypothetical protein HFJ33_02000 [Clostridia bacterium]|nr:hypothetical protein [Clostridia bacterium]